MKMETWRRSIRPAQCKDTGTFVGPCLAVSDATLLVKRPLNADRALMTVTHATDFLQNGSNWVNAVAFTPKKDNEVVSASSDRTIKVWSLADGQCKQTLHGHG